MPENVPYQNAAATPVCETDANGTRWTLNGQFHRVDGPAVESSKGGEESWSWYFNGKLHREDGPASMGISGTLVWYIHGARHREDGPAIERLDGAHEWWLEGRQFTEADFLQECARRAREKDQAFALEIRKATTVMQDTLVYAPRLNITMKPRMGT